MDLTRIIRLCVLGMVAVLMAVGIPSCGGDDDDDSSDTEVTEELTNRYDAAVNELNSAVRTYNTRSTQDVQRQNLAALKSDTATLRTAYFEFDKTLRELALPASLEDEVNAVLDAQGTVIADLDAVGEASSGPEALDLIQRFRTDKADQYDPATDTLADALRQGLEDGQSDD